MVYNSVTELIRRNVHITSAEKVKLYEIPVFYIDAPENLTKYLDLCLASPEVQ
jgi:hypothetical protein